MTTRDAPVLLTLLAVDPKRQRSSNPGVENSVKYLVGGGGAGSCVRFLVNLLALGKIDSLQLGVIAVKVLRLDRTFVLQELEPVGRDRELVFLPTNVFDEYRVRFQGMVVIGYQSTGVLRQYQLRGVYMYIYSSKLQKKPDLLVRDNRLQMHAVVQEIHD